MKRAMGKKILIVDDHPLILDLMKHIFDGLGNDDIELLMARDGKEGLRLALENNPDLAFLDITIPYLDGFEVCQRIKATGSKTYVILLAGLELEEGQSLATGADEWITKPFYPRQILQRAAAVLGLDIPDSN
jgi:DNA-binding response OmpR family regulator